MVTTGLLSRMKNVSRKIFLTGEVVKWVTQQWESSFQVSRSTS